MFSSVSNNSIFILRHCTFLLPSRVSLIYPSLRSFASPAPMDNSHNSNPKTSYARATPRQDMNDEAEKLVERMREQGLLPDVRMLLVVTLYSRISALGRPGSFLGLRDSSWICRLTENWDF